MPKKAKELPWDDQCPDVSHLNLADRRSYERECAEEERGCLTLRAVNRRRKPANWEEEHSANLQTTLAEPYPMGFDSPRHNLYFGRRTNIRYSED